MYSNSCMKQRVLLKGKDALDLLHRISSVDLKHPRLGVEQEGLILNPQGKILSYFKFTVLNENDALVQFEDEFLNLLDQYTFSEKYTIEPLPLTEEIEIPEAERIAQLKPKFGQEFKPDATTNPLEVNLKSAIHDQKGCYPGQEVIEKIISLGSPARRLCLLQTGIELSLLLPQTLRNAEGQDAGTLTSFAGTQGLAILKRPYAVEQKEVFAVDQNQNNVVLIVQKVSS